VLSPGKNTIRRMATGATLIVAIGITSLQASANDAERFFRDEVEPLLIRRCLECHGDSRQGGLDLRSRATLLSGGESGAVIVPGKPDESILLDKVFFQEMPPKKPLADEEIDILETWIRDGAFFPEQPIDPFSVTTDTRAGYDWWSLQPIVPVAPPAVDEAVRAGTLPESWTKHPVDRFIGAALGERALTPAAPADPVTLIRRATYGLTGLPPTPEEVAEFLRACAEETGESHRVGDRAYEELIDRLLASPHYGEHWGRHWLDIARFGESTGFEVNHLIDDAWPYRDYVIRSLNEDKPYDRMVLEQLAGDRVAPGDPDVEIGLAFLVSGPVDIVGNQDPAQAAQIRANDIDDMVRTTSETFLGLTTGCARCHDHKFDPISQKDFYRMHATFSGVYPASREVATDTQRRQRQEALAPLEARKAELAAERASIQQAVLARAEGRSPSYSDAWTRPPVDRTGTEESFAPVEAQFLRMVVTGRDNDPYAQSGFKIDEFEVWSTGSDPVNVALAANGGTADGKSAVAEDFGDAYLADLVIDGKFGQSWLARGSTLTLTFARTVLIDRVLFSSDRLGALAPGSPEAPFPCEYRIEVSVDGNDWIAVADSTDRQPANDAHRRKRLLELETSPEERDRLGEIASLEGELNRQIAAIPGLPVLRVGQLRQPDGATRMYLGGDPQRLGDEVAPESLDVLSRGALSPYRLVPDAPESERRWALAQWIVDKRNSLTPRVLANRLWHYHFGTGIVSTPSDFGFMGEPPTHPELLDWLAHELMEPSDPDAAPDDAWRLKRMHKLIMLSQTYRQAGTYRAEMADVDSESRLLWRFPPRRLTGEEIRDSMLAVAGVLDTRMGGPGFRLYRYIRDNVASYLPLDEYGPETYRRSVYHQNARASRIDLMTDFDAPDCAMSAPRRVSTTTPLQALTLMNHSFTLDMAEAWAERLAQRVGQMDSEALVTAAFQQAFFRLPNESERSASIRLVEDHGVRALCRALFNTNEFIYVN
jgi:hypothetical protein